MVFKEASVRRIWRAHGLKPHRVETFKISNDPAFAEKLEDIVGGAGIGLGTILLILLIAYMLGLFR